jgi:hypothetical protein
LIYPVLGYVGGEVEDLNSMAYPRRNRWVVDFADSHDRLVLIARISLPDGQEAAKELNVRESRM